MVEARWNIRVPMELDIQVLMPDNSRFSARTRNVSFEGMFIDANLPSEAFNSPVEVKFGCGEETIQAPALVVRTASDGTGLKFADWDDEVADALSRMMESELDCLLASKLSA